MTSLAAAFHLGVRYLRRSPLQSLLLASCLGLVFSLPLILRLFLHAAEQDMHHRATTTPLVLGARGSALDLVLSSLYFRRPPPAPITFADLQSAAHHDLATVIPLYIRFHAQQAPIVGTQMEYFTARQLSFAAGHAFARLGDCVLGANLAAARQLRPGDALFSSPEQAFDLAGAYPLKMRITGVLAATGTADDDAAFVDLKTAWLIEGRAHGHDDLATLPTEQLLATDQGPLVGSAAVRLFNEVTPQNIRSFHFHGNLADYPVTSVLLFPRDSKADALLSGRYQKTESPVQLVSPPDQIGSLLTSLFQIERLLILLFAITASCALGITALVFALSFRLREREFRTLNDLGVGRLQLLGVHVIEIGLILSIALAIATVMTLSAQLVAGSLVRVLLS
jgi:putative ABC transport system permease protein